MLGRTIGNYVVKRKIGEGGMGAVYLAEHPRIGRIVAIKVLHPQLGKNPEIVARFFTEARSANEIRNEHIIDILDFGELSDGSSYLIMEWLDGVSLTEALEKQPRFELRRAIHVARGVGKALAAAHARGIVHRDLKPDNIFLVQRGEDPDFVKVLDFGIAKLMQHDESAAYKTQTGAIMGTPYYMSPEQCRGATKDIDQRTDIYALGVILYQMVTGRLPFDAEGLGDLLLAHMTVPPPPPHTIDPSIPSSVEEAILHALAKEPAKRFSRIEELLSALASDSRSVAAALPGPPATAPSSLPPVGGTRMARPTGAPAPAPAATSEPSPAPASGPAATGAKPFLQTTLGGAAGETLARTSGSERTGLAIRVGAIAGLLVVGILLLIQLRRPNAPQPLPQPLAAPMAPAAAAPAGPPPPPRASPTPTLPPPAPSRPVAAPAVDAGVGRPASPGPSAQPGPRRPSRPKTKKPSIDPNFPPE